MSDSSFQLLLPYLQNNQLNTLWIADENVLVAGKIIAARDRLAVITNRHDVYQDGLRRSLNISFSDYDLNHIADNSLNQVVYRISKEKPVVHHVINEAFRTLQKNGLLIISGEKSEGVKSCIDKASRLFGLKVSPKKDGNSYLGVIKKSVDFEASLCLDDKDYTNTRKITEINSAAVFSKPGLFGWDKEDQGSRLLMDTTETYFESHSRPQSILDLGCGYGYLTLKTAGWAGIKQRCATDNNAAAIMCATKNFTTAHMDVTVIPDDCGSSITDRFDVILCNPPFHQGFSVDSTLTDKFLRNSSNRVNSKGVALFVVNQFIGIEKKARDYFSRVECLANDKQFKVLALYK